jgi:hypothetical protein
MLDSSVKHVYTSREARSSQRKATTEFWARNVACVTPVKMAPVTTSCSTADAGCFVHPENREHLRFARLLLALRDV